MFYRNIIILIAFAVTAITACSVQPNKTMPDELSQQLVRFERNFASYLKTHDVRYENQVINERLLSELKGKWTRMNSENSHDFKLFSQGHWTVKLVDGRVEAVFALIADFSHNVFVDYDVWLKNSEKVEVIRDGISLN